MVMGSPFVLTLQSHSLLESLRRVRSAVYILMFMVLLGQTISICGTTLSHGVAELSSMQSQWDEHPHSHDHDEGVQADTLERHTHHDTGNHSHDSMNWLGCSELPEFASPLTPLFRYRVASPSMFNYQLERPPKEYSLVT